jgi:hypothetical protein
MAWWWPWRRNAPATPTVRHYLIFWAERPRAIHHRRNGDGWDTRILTDGEIGIDPPGLTITPAEIYPAGT